jgi:hypothetical protein
VYSVLALSLHRVSAALQILTFRLRRLFLVARKKSTNTPKSTPGPQHMCTTKVTTASYSGNNLKYFITSFHSWNTKYNFCP